MVMVVGKVVIVTPPDRDSMASGGRTAFYDFEVSEWLKPSPGEPPGRLVIVETWAATHTADLRPGVETLLFLRRSGSQYQSVRETYLNSPGGRQALLGVRLFLRLIGAAERERACLGAWNRNLSDAEKVAVLDAMWESKTGRYSERLLQIALGNESARIRGRALSILGPIENGTGVEALVPRLESETDCGVRRQMLLVFGTYRVQSAVPAIDELLAGSHAGQCEAWRVESLRAMAREARDKITGKNTSLGWKH